MVARFFFLSYLFSSSIFADETMCGDPEQPLYSTIQRLSDQSIVYACLKGYKMEAGDPRRDCVNGVWTGPPPPRCSGPIDPPLLFIFYSLMLTRRRNEVVVGKKGRKGNGEGGSREIPREKQLRLGNALLLPESI